MAFINRFNCKIVHIKIYIFDLITKYYNCIRKGEGGVSVFNLDSKLIQFKSCITKLCICIQALFLSSILQNSNFSFSNPSQMREGSMVGPGVGFNSPTRAVPQTSSPGRESVISNFTVKSDMLQQPMFGDLRGSLANQEAADIVTSLNIEEYLQR